MRAISKAVTTTPTSLKDFLGLDRQTAVRVVYLQSPSTNTTPIQMGDSASQPFVIPTSSVEIQAESLKNIFVVGGDADDVLVALAVFH